MKTIHAHHPSIYISSWRVYPQKGIVKVFRTPGYNRRHGEEILPIGEVPEFIDYAIEHGLKLSGKDIVYYKMSGDFSRIKPFAVINTNCMYYENDYDPSIKIVRDKGGWNPSKISCWVVYPHLGQYVSISTEGRKLTRPILPITLKCDLK